MKKTIGAFIALAFLVGCGGQQDNTKGDKAQGVSDSAVSYNCEGETVKVDFNSEVEPQTANLYFVQKDVNIVLPSIESEIGMQYSDGDVTFWTHQDEATLSMEDTGASIVCTQEETLE